MTPTEAAGYIAGVGFCFVRRHYKFFSILMALAGLGIMLISISYVRIGTSDFDVRLGEGAVIGAMMMVVSVPLWLGCRTSRN